MKQIISSIAVLVIACASVFAKAPEAATDLSAALEKAAAGKKLLFIQFGREACGNCQALKAMIQNRSLRLPESQFVYVDLNCDDPATSKAFRTKYTVEGNTLPFVVIADPDGTQLASRSGYGSADEFEKLIRDAKKKSKAH